MGEGLVIGQSVRIKAADGFYAFIDGWQGVVSGFDSGCAWVTVPGKVERKFLVPVDQLEAV